MTGWAENNAEDRARGEAWEGAFESLATGLGFGCRKPVVRWFDRIVSRPGLPDEWHEIKDKYPAKGNLYGLEVYRFDELVKRAEAGALVLYTIHDSRLGVWLTADVLSLAEHLAPAVPGRSYHNSKGENGVPTYYWPTELWGPLLRLWGVGDMLAADLDWRQK